jgi:hypothetical protein
MFPAALGDGQDIFTYFLSAGPFGFLLGGITGDVIATHISGDRQFAATLAMWPGLIVGILAIVCGVWCHSVIAYGMLPLIWACLLIAYGVKIRKTEG